MMIYYGQQLDTPLHGRPDRWFRWSLVDVRRDLRIVST